MKSKMKKTFWILWAWLLLASNALMSFSNVTFAASCGANYYLETKWCYVFEHYYSNCDGSYLWSELVSYKCDEKWWEVDLREAPLEDGQYIKRIWEDAFSWTNVTKVIMPSTVMGVWDGAFCNVEREWNPSCGDGIIDKELWEECDDGSSDSGNWYTKCNLNCTIMDLPSCGNWQNDLWETCGNCPEDIYCGKSVDWLDDENLWWSEFLLKGQLPVEEIDESKSNDSDFVVVDFLSWMNNEFNTGTLSNACAKLQEYIVTFETEDEIVLWTWETFNQHIEPLDFPEAPEKEWFIWAWYLSGEIFDFNSQITDNIRLVYKYEKGWVEYDEENWWIKVSLWDQEIIVKDKNQWAEKTFSGVDVSSNDLIKTLGSYYFWWNNTWLDLSIIFDDNGQISDNVNLPEWFDHGYLWLEWWDDWTMWSNDTPCNADSWEYLPSPEEWKNLMQLWWKINGYEIVYNNWLYSFGDLGGLYPDLEHGGKSLNVSISAESGIHGVSPVSNVGEKFWSDLHIWLFPSLYLDNWWIWFDFNMQFLPSSLSNGKVWYLDIYYWLRLSHVSSLYWFENELATPVRCFVKPQFEVSFEVNGWTEVVTQKIFSWDNAVEPEGVQKENAEFLWWFKEDGTIFKFDTPITSDIKLHAEWQEKKTNNGYSGWWGGGSSSSSVKNSDKSDDPSKDKVSSASEVKENSTSEEKVDKEQQNNLVDDNQKQTEKTETVVTYKVSYVPDTALPEKEQAYDFAHTYWITTKTSVESAEMDKPLTRIQMSKMLSQYAMNVMWRQPDVSEWTVKFRDVTNDMDKSYDNWVTLSYQLWIMWQNMPNHKFRPNDIVTRAEFITALSRLLYSTSDGEYRSTSKYYVHHMEKLKNEWIITNDNPNMTEKRWYVMLMLLRSVK